MFVERALFSNGDDELRKHGNNIEILGFRFSPKKGNGFFEVTLFFWRNTKINIAQNSGIIESIEPIFSYFSFEFFFSLNVFVFHGWMG